MSDTPTIKQLIEEFDKRVPQIKKDRKSDYDLRERFVNYFTLKKIASMNFEDYCLGLDNSTLENFSYGLEYLLESLGSIKGANSSKWGIYYSKESGKYKTSATYSKLYYSSEDVFNQVKQDWIDLYHAGATHDLSAIIRNKLNDWVKAKFLTIYYPDDYLNVFKRNDLTVCIEAFGESGDYKDAFYLREQLIQIKNNDPTMKYWPMNIYGWFLWGTVAGHDDSESNEEASKDDAIEMSPIRLKEQFRQYLSTCVRTSDRKKAYDTDFFLTDPVIVNYVNYAEADKLFDYSPEKWEHIESIYNITSSATILDIMGQLFSEKGFVDQEQKNSQYYRSNGIKYYYLFLKARELFLNTHVLTPVETGSKAEEYEKYLNALRTKPFLLLAGISGTGKSRIVRELAYRSCPPGELRSDKTTPGNYLMVEVKPNWHDSSELKGYYSNISGKYMLTPFIKFLVKAKHHPDVPFFVCLDEMNLAQVEQYFAEYLSILETRSKTSKGIKTGVLVEGKYLAELGETEDLTLPENLFVVGTVNMDDTTHKFSRKVIDRAMTIEMNGGELTEMFGRSADLEYTDDFWTMGKELKVQYVTADEVVEAHSDWAARIKKELPERLEEINECLNNTPFEVSYRVLNELVIYLGVLLDNAVAVDDAKFEELVDIAIDQILLMKVLPRIEGEEELFNLTKKEQEDHPFANKLAWLQSVCPDVEYADGSITSKKKLEEMLNRLEGGFTRFWP